MKNRSNLWKRIAALFIVCSMVLGESSFTHVNAEADDPEVRETTNEYDEPVETADITVEEPTVETENPVGEITEETPETLENFEQPIDESAVTDETILEVVEEVEPVKEVVEELQQENTQDDTAIELETTIAMPAQSFYQSTSHLEVIAEVNENVFPANTTMVVKEITQDQAIQIAEETCEESKEVVDAIGADITFYDALGNEIQPADVSSVYVSLRLVNTQLDGDEFNVIHKSEDEAAEVIDTNSITSKGADFETNTFSIYVISSETKIVKYTFYDADNTTKLSEQDVKKGDTLYAPASPEKENSIFVGWNTVQNATESTVSFTDKGLVISDTSNDVSLYPTYVPRLYVFFMDSVENDARVYKTFEATYENGAYQTFYIDDANVSLELDSEHSVTGWYLDKTLTQKVTELTFTNENICLYPNIEKGYYLNFVTGDGATTIAPHFYAATQKTEEVDTPIRPGYTFVEWVDENENAFTFGNTLTQTTTITASWKANPETSYTVIYWKQSVNDDKTAEENDTETYDYAEYEIKYGPTGSIVDGQDSKTYNGFHYHKTDEDVVIKGDGTTVVNVYYNRDLLTISFTYSNQKESTYVETTGDYWDQYGSEDGETFFSIHREIEYVYEPYTDGYYRYGLVNGDYKYLYSEIVYSYEEAEEPYSGNTYYGLVGGEYVQLRKDTWSNYKSITAQEARTKINNGVTVYGIRYDGHQTEYRQLRYQNGYWEIKKNNGNNKNYDYYRKSNGFYVAEESVTWKYSTWFSTYDYTGTIYVRTGQETKYYYFDDYSYEKVYYDGDHYQRGSLIYKWYDDDGNEYTGTRYVSSSKPHVEEYRGLFGQTLAQNNYTWPSDNIWKETNGTTLTFLDAFIFNNLDAENNNLTITTKNTVSGNHTLNHYKQNLDGSYSYTNPSNSTKSNSGATWYFTNKYNGFTVSSYYASSQTKDQISDDSDWHTTSAGENATYENDQNLYVRYTRNSYRLAFYDYNSTVKEESVLYEGSLVSYANYEPTRPSELEDVYDFKGWYKDAACTEEFDFNTTMPASDLMIYAKWEAPTEEIDVFKNITIDSPTKAFVIQYNETINELDLPTIVQKIDDEEVVISQGDDSCKIEIPEGKKWAGWSTFDGTSYIKFNFDTPIKEITKLYPHYISNEAFTVTYNPGDGTGKVVDAKRYAEDSYADIQSADSIDAPDGKVFLYWTDGTNKYYPQDKILITSDIKLVAVYGEQSALVSLIYYSDSDKTSSYEQVVGASNNKQVTLADATTSGFTREGYQLVGWTDQKNNFNLNAKVGIDNDGKTLVEGTITNTLYAIWKPIIIINISGKSSEKVYSGLPQSFDEYDISIEGPKDFDISAVTVSVKDDESIAASGTDVDTYATTLTSNQFEVSNADDYVIQWNVSGETKLDITPATLTITTPTASKVYDGNPLTAAGTIDGFVNGETASFTTTGRITEVGGPIDNTYTLVWDGSAKKGNYKISEDIGTLTITENQTEITVTTTGGTYTYDGQPHGATVSVSELPKGYTLKTAESSATATDVTKTAVKATADKLVIINAQGKDVTSKLNIKKIDGTIIVNPAQVTVTTKGGNKVYDGSPLTGSGKVEGIVDGETYTFTITGKQIKVGDSKNTYKLVWDGTANEDNYIVSENLGTLVVSEAADEIVVTTTGGTFTYDGQPHGATVSVSELPKGYTLQTAKSNTTATDVTKTAVKATADELVIVNEDGENVTSKLKIKYVDGTITVTPATLTITTPTASKVYDGEPLTAAGTIDGFVNDETATFKTTGTITEVGGPINNAYTLVWDGTANEDNYIISETIGKLSITENQTEITVTTTGGTTTYDGQPHGATVSVSELPKGYTLQTAKSTATAIDVTKEVVNATADKLVIVNKEGKDVASKLNIKYVDGTVKVTPATLTITTPTASKVYDGNPLTAAGTIDGFVNGETASFTTTGTITEVGGPIDNTYTLVWDGSAKKGNYKISEDIGTLTITENQTAITVTTTGGTYTYDGQPHGATVSVSELPKGYTLQTATSSATATDVTKTPVNATADQLVIINAQGKDVTSNLNIKYVDGTIEVTPAPLTVVTEDGNKEYDGKPLTANGSITGFVNDETATFELIGSITDAGSIPNAYRIDWNGTAKETNYEINETIGTLTITENTSEIIITSGSASKVYDGTVLTDHSYTVTGLPEGFEINDVKIEGEITNVGTVVNKITGVVINKKSESGILAKAFKALFNMADANAETDESGNFSNITFVSGTLEVTAAAVIVTVDDFTKTEGQEDPTFTAKVEGLVGTDTIDYTITRDPGEEVGAYYVRPTGDTVQGNYQITYVNGILTINRAPSPIVPDTSDDEKPDVLDTSDDMKPETPSTNRMRPVTPDTSDSTNTSAWTGLFGSLSVLIGAVWALLNDRKKRS